MVGSFKEREHQEVDQFFLRRLGKQCGPIRQRGTGKERNRNQAEENLIIEHDLLKTLMNNIPDSVYFKDEQNKFILVNKAKADHSNVSQEEMINKTDFDFLPEDQAKRILDDDNHIMQSGHPIINKL